MYKILISGYYGFNNIGDESILSAVTDKLNSFARAPDAAEPLPSTEGCGGAVAIPFLSMMRRIPSTSSNRLRLVIEGGSIKDAYGAKVATKGGSAEENTVDITGGSVTGSVYGGALTMAGATGSANKNTINLKTNVTGDIYGGFTAGTGKTAQNTVTIGDGETALNLTFAGILHGGNSTAADGNKGNT